MSTWQSYDSEREIKFIDECMVLKPKKKPDLVEVEPVPLLCLLCEFPMKTTEDFMSFRSWKCCQQCELKFAKPYAENWLKGWRPNKSSPEFLAYIETRFQLYKPLIRFR